MFVSDSICSIVCLLLLFGIAKSSSANLSGVHGASLCCVLGYWKVTLMLGSCWKNVVAIVASLIWRASIRKSRSVVSLM